MAKHTELMKEKNFKIWTIVLAIIGAMQNIAILLNVLGEAIDGFIKAIAPYANIIIIGLIAYFFLKKKR